MGVEMVTKWTRKYRLIVGGVCIIPLVILSGWWLFEAVIAHQQGRYVRQVLICLTVTGVWGAWWWWLIADRE
jgi:hypothetical protein